MGRQHGLLSRNGLHAIIAIVRSADRIDAMMHLAIFGLRLIEVMFFVGLAGSTIVILISFVEDERSCLAKTKYLPARALRHLY